MSFKQRSEGDEGISYGDIWGKEVEGTESKSSEVEECLAISWECKDDRLARQLKSRWKLKRWSKKSQGQGWEGIVSRTLEARNYLTITFASYR